MDRCGVGTCNTVRVQWNVSNRLGVEKHLLNYRRRGGGGTLGISGWGCAAGTLEPIPSPRHIHILPIYGSTPPPVQAPLTSFPKEISPAKRNGLKTTKNDSVVNNFIIFDIFQRLQRTTASSQWLPGDFVSMKKC